MNKHVASDKTSRELKEAGFPQDTEWSLVDEQFQVVLKRTAEIDKHFERLAKPMLMEITKELPPTKEGGKGATYFFTAMRSGKDGEWVVGYYSPIKVTNFYDWLVKVNNVSLIEACARLWLQLKEEDGDGI